MTNLGRWTVRNSTKVVRVLALLALATCAEFPTFPTIPKTETKPVSLPVNFPTTVGGSGTVSVTILDSNDRPASGVVVQFTLESGQASVTDAMPITGPRANALTGNVNPPSATTGPDGVASTIWTLGTTAGVQRLVARAGNSVQTFTQTVLAGAPAKLIPDPSVSVQTSGPAGSAVTPAPVVRLADQFDNFVTTGASGRTVSFSVTGGGTVTPSSTTTDALGIARVGTWTLGSQAGANGLTATSSGLQPATFNVAAVSSTASSVGANSTQSQSGVVVNTNVPAAPSVIVRDAGNNPVNGVSVIFTVASGAGSVGGLNSETVVTGANGSANGVATVSSWRVGQLVGSNSVTATVSGISTPVTFTATSTHGPAAQMALNAPATGSYGTVTVSTAVSPPPSVTIRDQFGNLASGASVTFSVASGGGTVTGGSATSISSGVASAGSWTMGPVAGTTNTLTATNPALTGSPVTFTAIGGQGTGTIAFFSPSTGSYGSVAVGTTVTPVPAVRIADANGNAIVGVAVTFTVTSGGGSVTGGTTSTNASGIATAGSWTLGNSAGANSLSASAPSTTNGSVVFTATGISGGATQLALTTQAAGAVAGSAFTTQPIVAVRDANGNTVTTSSASVTMTVSAGSSVIGTATVNASNGIATFANVGLSGTAGSRTLTFASTGLTSATQSITLAPGAASSMTKDAGDSQTGVTAGSATPVRPRVLITDQFNNPIANRNVTFTIASGAGTVNGGASAVIATDASGLAEVTSWVLGAAAGTNTLTAASTGLTTVTFTATSVPGSGTISANSATSQSAVAGANVATPPSVIVRDANNNPLNNVAVTFAVIGAGSVNGQSSVIVNTGSNGIATLTSWTLSTTAGLNAVTASASGVSGSPVTFTATGTPGAATQVVLTTQAAGAVAGSAFSTQPVLAIRDANGNTVTSSTASVTMTVSAGPTVTGTATVSASSGVVTFSGVGLTGTAGSHTLTFASSGLTSATQSITLAPGSATQLALTTGAAGASAGTAFTTQPVVAIRDASGNTVTSSSAAVTLTVSSGATVIGTATVNAANGIATFTNTGLTGVPASYTLTFASAGLTSATQSITLNLGAASQLVLTTQAAGAASAAAFTTQPVVAIRDAGGNTVTTNTAAVTMTVSSGPTIIGTSTVNAVAGVATFTNVGLSGTAGSYTLTFSSSGLTNATQSITLGAGAASQITVITPAAGAGTGVAFTTQPVVAIRDAQNNIVTTSTASVTLSVGAGATTIGTVTVNAASGVATFTNAGLTGTLGNYTLTYASAGLTSATQSITLGAGPATKLVLATPVAAAVNGAAFGTQPVIQVQDAQNNVVTTSSASVTMAVSAGGTLTGTVTINATNGIATFSGTGLNGPAASYTLTFSSGSLTAASQAGLALAVGAANNLIVTTAAATAASGAAFGTQPVITVRDVGGNTVTSSSLAITIGVSAGGTLSGTTTVNAASGVATFAGVGISGLAGSYTLSYSATGVTGTSQNITLVAGAASQLVITTPAAGAVSGLAFTTQPIVAIRDAAGNSVTGSAASVTMAVSAGGATLGTVTINAVSGVATFSGVGITAAAGTYTLTFSSAGLTNATQSVTIP